MRGVACVLAAAVAVAATGCTRDEKQSAVPVDAVAAAPRPGHPVRSHANQAHAVPPRAAGSHAGGCVRVNSHSEWEATLWWLDPSQNPRIVIKS